MNLIEITPVQLFLCLLFVLLAGLGSFMLKLKLEKDLAWGTVRTFAQLFIMGYILKFIFQLNNVVFILLLYTFMIFWAAHAVRGRVKEDSVRFFVPTFVSMVASYMLVSILVTVVIVQVKPWYTPQYFIPLGGMIIGNAMNAITIALDRLFSDLRQHRAEIELSLSLGASYQEATHSVMRDAVKAGMIPSINALIDRGPGLVAGHDDRANSGWHRSPDRDQISDRCNAHDRGCHGDRVGADCSRGEASLLYQSPPDEHFNRAYRHNSLAWVWDLRRARAGSSIGLESFDKNTVIKIDDDRTRGT